MKYTVLTLFPEIPDAFFATSIMAKAIKKGIIQYQSVNIRDFAKDKHKTCDDAPYGGGPGMLMLPEPLGLALKSVLEESTPPSSPLPTGYRHASEPHSPLPIKKPRVIYLSPSGRPFNQELAKELASESELVLICGRYEGIDQRIIDLFVDDEISVGDFVLSSGEVAALTVIDATYRLVDKVIREESLAEESFSDGLLEYPQFTRPEEYANIKVPDILKSGHHEQIRLWQLEQRVKKTLRQRPDMIRHGKEVGLFNKEILNIIERMERIEGECHERN